MATNSAEYARSHYEANKEKYKATARAHTERQRRVVRALIDEAKSAPCADCGMRYPPYVMDFDHRKDKLYTIANMITGGYSVSKVLAEIAKCDVVCANCHRIRTYGGEDTAGK